MVYTNSATQPFVLQPTSAISGTDAHCSTLDNRHPLLMDHIVVVAIDSRAVDIGQLRILNINMTTQQGTAINPTPLRPSFGAGAPASNLGAGGIYFLVWPNPLPGDILATLSVNLVFTAPAPGAAWSEHTVYPAGSIVTTGNGDGHFYLSTNGGVSASRSPAWTPAVPATDTDGNVTWQHIGTSLPQGIPQAMPWDTGKAYAPGNVILSPTNANYYLAISTKGNGKPGPALPVFPFTKPAPPTEDADPIENPTTFDPEGAVLGVEWQATDGVTPKCAVPNEAWQANHPYKKDETACDPYDGRVYKVLVAGTSGNKKPTFKSFASALPIRWIDLGTVPPATVTSGQATDQSVNLLTLQLPQSHSLSYFNLAAGLVRSSIQTQTFGLPAGATTTGDEVVTSSSPILDPVLLFTAYLQPLDAESRCGWTCWLRVPGITAGLSLASPASNFYAGLSFELIRNVQAVAGYSWAKVPAKPTQTLPLTGNAPAAVTVQQFSTGTFIGLTFNFTGFVQSLFSGGGGGGASKSSSGQ
jgi:hypothetical protein